jgi:endonuclease/exonuclease/phosphatase (EEP) superfamily protein YafD
VLGCSDAPRPAARPALPGELLVATFNIYFPAADDAETVAAVGETAADVVLLQEVSPRWQQVLEERYSVTYPYRLFAPAGGAGGLGVLSRFPLVDEGLLAAAIRHPAWLVGVHTPAGELHVLNVHLRSSRRPGEPLLPGLFSMSSDHEREIRTFLGAARVAPQIVAGDFNEGPRGGAVSWLVQHGFVDALEQHAPGASTFRTLGGLYSSTLDHVLIGAELRATDAWVLERGNSDHWPVVARLRRAGEPKR